MLFLLLWNIAASLNIPAGKVEMYGFVVTDKLIRPH
jgi:glutamine cyclotransferase